MKYYKVAILNKNLEPLTYHFDKNVSIYSIVEVVLKNKLHKGVIIKEVEKPIFKTAEISTVLEEKLSKMQISLANFISYYYISKIGISFNLFTPYKNKNDQNINFKLKPNLSPNQQKGYEFIKNNQISLLFGDTGSGKSEIYISLLVDILNKGKQALFLMPEISLTPQMEKRLKKYFGDHIGVWHSKITKSEKEKLLKDFENGDIKLIAGARSALFLPFTNLGLIIVDEEHDDSYKSSQNPRYNAKDLALYIAKKLDSKIVLGSATPSLSSFVKHPSFRLKGTYFSSQKTIDYDISETKITPKILQELKNTLSNKNQAIVFLPTRANFKYMICKECKTIVTCPYCSVGMSFHKSKNALVCHYCGFSMYAKTNCEKCGNEVLESKRMGTSEVVSQLQSYFPSANIAKFDRDEITTQKKLINILSDFNDGKIDILVGTQMLSKGHDYHNVKLAVVMGIDAGLSYADYKAREKTLSLAIQIAGRSGRTGKGKILLQTEQADFFKDYIENYDKFLKEEKYYRDGLYPPFTRLLRILISHKNEKKAEESMQICLNNLKKIEDIEMIGYGKAAIEYISSKYRYEILIRANSHKPLIKAGNICDTTNVQIDMDPISFS
ncbi:primosomal protein N' [Campylobacter blaseri]|uniref:Replication restart protein PriA n=1 Tax=Campylobacter blaseri TaxID=2042961 RepID=A0A2P8QZZ0_9BACT|nr:primosomal protein N' [Campylobacter blaseri]PSM51821.1 primosomal protein N' [Campylobacter blaseri]PSM53612.1 primosomal protein N' [Campylobacter blaseri]QKF86425.1 primosomal protein N' [Campylobacter blaseri]